MHGGSAKHTCFCADLVQSGKQDVARQQASFKEEKQQLQSQLDAQQQQATGQALKFQRQQEQLSQQLRLARVSKYPAGYMCICCACSLCAASLLPVWLPDRFVSTLSNFDVMITSP